MQKIKVRSKETGKTYVFTIQIHGSSKNKKRKIEEKFYLENSLKPLKDEEPHNEIEIIDLKTEGKTYPPKKMQEDLKNGKFIHLHLSKKNQRHFICLAIQIPNPKEALTIAKTWCADTVYTIEKGESFGVFAKKI